MKHQFKPWQPVIVRDENVHKWYANFFSHYEEGRQSKFCCVIGCWKQCLPAEGNEHLIGTTDSPASPEPEFKFGDKVEARNKESERWIRARFIVGVGANSALMPYFVYIDDTSSIFNGDTAHFLHIRHADW